MKTSVLLSLVQKHKGRCEVPVHGRNESLYLLVVKKDLIDALQQLNPDDNEFDADLVNGVLRLDRADTR